MAITNQDKPTVGTAQTELSIGGGFNLLVGGGYKLIIGALNAISGMTNNVRPSQGLTWGAILTTWASETDTWEGVSQTIDNFARPSSSFTNVSKP